MAGLSAISVAALILLLMFIASTSAVIQRIDVLTGTLIICMVGAMSVLILLGASYVKKGSV